MFFLVTILINSFSCDFSDTKEISSDSVYTCPVENDIIKSDPVKFEYIGRTYYFCCSGCEMLFKKEPGRYILTDLMCLPCSDYDAKREIYFIYDEVKYYFCSRSCAGKFRKAPGKFLNGK